MRTYERAAWRSECGTLELTKLRELVGQMEEWSVDVQAVVDPTLADDDEAIDSILETLAPYGAALAFDQGGPHMSIQMTVEAEDFMAATQKAVGLIVGLPYRVFPSGARVLTVADLQRELDKPAIPDLVGVAEVAEELHVSKARVSELQDSPAFPEPIARLKSGPVWTRPSLTRFLESWERKPGRPRKIADASV